MKLYYAPGTCSLASHIVAAEAGLPLELERVDLGTHRLATGADYRSVNPLGYVPALLLDDGALLTEGAAILQYLADLAPETHLAPPAGSVERTRLQQWLSFIATELHKSFSPWLFHPEVGEAAQEFAKARLAERFAHVDGRLTEATYLLGSRFTVADAYAFTILGWAKPTRIDLAPYPHLERYLARIGERPKVREALVGHRMRAAA